MTFNINVVGGTHAGWRRTSPKRSPWTCMACKTNLAAHWPACPSCKSPAPSSA